MVYFIIGWCALIVVIQTKCTYLSILASGHIVPCSSGGRTEMNYYEEETCNFTCNTGYEITGSDTRTCLTYSNSSVSESTCKRGK